MMPLLTAFLAAIVIDGNISDWNDIPFYKVTPASGVTDLTSRPYDSDAAADLSFRFATASDEDAFYVVVEVTDDRTVADSCEAGSISAPAWDDDAVEVFIDGNYNRAPDSRADNGEELRFGGEFSLVANGAAMSDFSGYPKTFGSKWFGATNYDEVKSGKAEKMIYEFRLPWEVMGLDSKPQKIGFTISVQDDDYGGRRDHALYWKGSTERPYSDESQFGTIIFSDKTIQKTK